MKTLTRNLAFTTLLITILFSGQAQTLSYQGALRLANGEVMSHTPIDLRISLFVEDVKIFEEEHLGVQTSDAGIFNLRVGSVKPTLFQQLNFEQKMDISTEIKVSDSYESVSRETISAVPLAMHAYSVANVDDADADSTNELQSLTFDPTRTLLSLSNGGQVDLSILRNSNHGSDNQKLSISGTKLSIEGGNSVDLVALQDGVMDADADPKNELQQISKVGNRIKLSDGGEIIDAVEDSDPNPENEIQKLSLNKSNKELSLSKGGGKVDLGSVLGNNPDQYWQKQGDEINNKEARVRINGILTANNGINIGKLNYGQGGIKGIPNQYSSITLAPSESPLGKTILLEGKVGIGDIGGSPKANLHIAPGQAVGKDIGATLMVGNNHKNIAIGTKVIQARENFKPSDLLLNPHGGRLLSPKLPYIGDKANMQYNTTTGEIGYDNSSRRYKTNISSLVDDWGKILKSHPVRYDRPTSPGVWEYGYIAEEMDSIGLRNLVSYDQEGFPENFNYEKMILYVTELLKEHEIQIQILQQKNKEVNELRAQLDQQKHGLVSLQKRLSTLENAEDLSRNIRNKKMANKLEINWVAHTVGSAAHLIKSLK